MQVGVFYFPAYYGINIAELAQALETRGFASLYVPEHSRIPVSRSSPFPGGQLPKEYSRTHHDEILRLLDTYAPLTAAG